ncbi:MAG TPA: pyridoxal phosphate-dependent aminotransferase [Longimicrobiales bacterium]|nr:pyridoxal phosphate-dependent aminotransferase [Longimicrobiales bacterium]
MPAAMSELSENVRTLQPSATIAVASKARELKAQGRDIVDLSAGEPDFPTPRFIAEAGRAAIEAGRTRYTPAAGILELRQAVARDLAERHGQAVDPAGVVVSAGAKQALFNSLFALVGPGDKVLVPVPYWTSYPEMVSLARAQPVAVRGPEARGYRVGPEELEAAWSPDVRVLLLNSPSNPSGAVYRAAELEAILAWAADRGVWVVSDEIYGRLCYLDGPAPSIHDFPPNLRERTVLIDGASKVFAMTGWRIGWSVSDPRLASTLSALQSHTTSNAATPSQYAALAALTATAEQDAVLERMAAEFRDRRDLVLRLLEQHFPGTGRVAPEGAFYLFFRVDGWFDQERPDSVALCTWLIEHAGVALVPGSAFGDDRYVRLSFAASTDALSDGFARLARTLGA